MKPNIWIFSIEPIETRYTAQWHSHIPKLLKKSLEDQYNIIQIDGIQKNSQTTPGAFLNFSDTNYWKSSQLCSFLEYYNQRKTTPKDQFIFTDAWNPVIAQIKYMNDLLGSDWKIHSLWHAGSYDPADFLGRLIGDASWVRSLEKSFFHASDFNYFATEFHIKMFTKTILGTDSSVFRYDAESMSFGKIIRSGWPMEYMPDLLLPYKNKPKKNLIVFPHRIAPEKQVEIFYDLKHQLPNYEFIVCQEKTLTKDQYHSILAQAKIVFSCSQQETLGIGTYEGILLDAIPMVPDRLSYAEMYPENFKYPSEWTENWDSYLIHRHLLIDTINAHLNNYEKDLSKLSAISAVLTNNFFSAEQLIAVIKQQNL